MKLFCNTYAPQHVTDFIDTFTAKAIDRKLLTRTLINVVKLEGITITKTNDPHSVILGLGAFKDTMTMFVEYDKSILKVFFEQIQAAQEITDDLVLSSTSTGTSTTIRYCVFHLLVQKYPGIEINIGQ